VSPDGRTLAGIGWRPWLTRIDGGWHARYFPVDLQFAAGGRWIHADRLLVSTDQGRLRVVPVRANGPGTPASVDEAWPLLRLVPSIDRIVFAAGERHDEAALFLFRTDPARLEVLSTLQSWPGWENPVARRFGERLVYVADGLFWVPLDRPGVATEPTAILAPWGLSLDFAPAGDGRPLVVHAHPTNWADDPMPALYRLSLEGAAPVRLTPALELAGDPRAWLDERRVLVSGQHVERTIEAVDTAEAAPPVEVLRVPGADVELLDVVP
jgi:hypothetical protein